MVPRVARFLNFCDEPNTPGPGFVAVTWDFWNRYRNPPKPDRAHGDGCLQMSFFALRMKSTTRSR